MAQPQLHDVALPGSDGLSTVRPRLVLLGGVPGAGKTTALRGLAAAAPAVRTLDPEGWRDRVAASLPWLPYRGYRWLVHLVSIIQLLAALARRSGPLVVHAPATRPRRRTLVGWLAALRGWEPVLVYLDVSRREALLGQYRRGRVLRAPAFARHWSRWERQRAALVAADRTGSSQGPWTRVVVVDRSDALPALSGLVSAAS